MKISGILNQAENFYKKALWSYFLTKVNIKNGSYNINASDDGDDGEDDPTWDASDDGDDGEDDPTWDAAAEAAYIAANTLIYEKYKDPRFGPRPKPEEGTPEDVTPEEVTSKDVTPKYVQHAYSNKIILAELKKIQSSINNPLTKSLLSTYIRAFEEVDGLTASYFSIRDDSKLNAFNAKASRSREDFIKASNILRGNIENNFILYKTDLEKIGLTEDQLTNIFDSARNLVYKTILDLTGTDSGEDFNLKTNDPEGESSPYSNISAEVAKDFAENQKGGDGLDQLGNYKREQARQSSKNRRDKLKAAIKNNNLQIMHLAQKIADGAIDKDGFEVNKSREEYIKRYPKNQDQARKIFDTELNLLVTRYKDNNRAKFALSVLKADPKAYAKHKDLKANQTEIWREKFSRKNILDKISQYNDAKLEHEKLKLIAAGLKGDNDSNAETHARDAAYKQFVIVNTLKASYDDLKKKSDHVRDQSAKAQLLDRADRHDEFGNVRFIADARTFKEVIASMYEHTNNLQWSDVKNHINIIKNGILMQLDAAETAVMSELDKQAINDKYAALMTSYTSIVAGKKALKKEKELGSDNEAIKEEAKASIKAGSQAMTKYIGKILKDEVLRQSIFSSWKDKVDKIVKLRLHIKDSYDRFIDLNNKLQELLDLGIVGLSDDSINEGIENKTIKRQALENTVIKLTEYAIYAEKLTKIPIKTYGGRDRRNSNLILVSAVNALNYEVKRFYNLLNPTTAI